MLKKIFIFGILCAFFVLGCDSDEYGITITFENTTNEEIRLISLSNMVKNDMPLSIKPNSKAQVYSVYCQSQKVVFSHNGKIFETDTGYYTNLSRYTIKFSNNTENDLECTFMAKFYYYDDDIRDMDLEEIGDKND